MRTIKTVYDEECAELKIDARFYKKVCDLESRFVSKNQESLEFFGGNLLGVHRVRFTADDRDRLFTDLLEADDRSLQDQVYALRSASGQPVINQDWNISSDIFNISVVWLLHAIHHSPHLDKDKKQEAKVRLTMYLLYKFLTSLMFNGFKYPADPEIAAATYAQMSLKFILKQTGNWGATLRVLATNAVAEDGIHANAISKMDDDLRVINFLNDVQGRIRDMFKNIYSLLVRTKEQGKRISNSSSLIETDGELVLKDKTQSLNNYTRYLKGIVGDKNTFIRLELIDVIARVMHTMPEKLLVSSLAWMSDNYARTKDGIVEDAINRTMEHAFEYLAANRAVAAAKGDIPGLISKLRGSYMSSRSTERNLLEIRVLVEKIVVLATQSKNESVVASTRTGVMLYIVLRAFCMKHYASR
jgi:hypothetical protein